MTTRSCDTCYYQNPEWPCRRCSPPGPNGDLGDAWKPNYAALRTDLQAARKALALREKVVGAAETYRAAVQTMYDETPTLVHSTATHDAALHFDIALAALRAAEGEGGE
jgi:hypothetical protein